MLVLRAAPHATPGNSTLSLYTPSVGSPSFGQYLWNNDDPRRKLNPTTLAPFTALGVGVAETWDCHMWAAPTERGYGGRGGLTALSDVSIRAVPHGGQGQESGKGKGQGRRYIHTTYIPTYIHT